MATGGNGQKSGRRQLLLVAALVAWIGVILVAAGRQPEDPPLVGVENLDAVLLVGVLLAAAAGLVLLIILNPFQSEWTEPGRRPGSYAYLILLLVALILLLWHPQIVEDLLDGQEDEEETEDDNLEELLAEQTNQEPPETVAEATEILALVVVVGGIVGAVFLFKRRAEPPPHTINDEEFEAELIVAMDEARVELGEATDPRSAVLNAYRSLEVVFETRGSPRARSETTTEHITRSLRSVTVDPAPIAQLGELYQVARFSEQQITVEQQASAKAALEQATAELRRRA